MDYNTLIKEKIGRVISVGDKVPCIRFDVIHSRFDNVINFLVEEHIVSVVTPKIDPGPFRIMVDNVDLQPITTVRLTLDDFRINHAVILSRERAEHYNSTWNAEQSSPALLQNNISLLRDHLIAKEPDMSLLNLLKPKPEQNNLSPFDLELMVQLRQAYKVLLNNDILSAVDGFRGRGYGQTPSGDDFNTGLLMGLTIRQKCEKKELSNIRSSVYSHSLGKNLLVNTFLLQAYHGWFNENWKTLLSVLSGQTPDFETAVNRILAQGRLPELTQWQALFQPGIH